MFQGKKILVLGVANERSIAWAITEALHNAGAQIALSYANEALKKRVLPLAEKISCEHIFEADVQDDAALDRMFNEIESRWGSLDGVVHSVAYAEREDLLNPYSETSRDGFRLALDVSAYSLVAIAKRAKHLMKDGGSILTLSYLGAERVVTNYNVMGVAKAALEASVRYLASDLGSQNIRVNALSAGPLKTLAASGIPQFKQLLTQFAAMAPLGRVVTLEDVAGAGQFLMSDLSSGVTGETLYVDCGFNVMAI